MSLRLRLTLLYSTFMGGILLIFGAAVYLLVNVILLNQVDTMLAGVAREITQLTRVNSMGELNLVSLPPLDMTANAYVQVWGPDGKIIATSPSIGILTESLDPAGLEAGRAIYEDSSLNGAHLRVLSVPLMISGRMIGILQVGSSLSVVDATQGNLISVMGVIAVIAVLMAGFGSWVILGRALSPLEDIADTVDQINRADDLSRRIPHQEKTEDEIGDLVMSFNQTLERLESLFTSQQRFLADVSHELRTPLTVIKGNVDLIRHIKQADEESLSSIDQEAGRLSRLVGGLLMLAQAESGKLALNMEPVELDLLLTEVFTEMCVLAGSKVHVHLNEIDQVMVNGDRDRLKQVFLNLISNAIQYTPQDGEVFLSLSKIGDQARVIIRDTGPGISARICRISSTASIAPRNRARVRIPAALGWVCPLRIGSWSTTAGRSRLNRKKGRVQHS